MEGERFVAYSRSRGVEIVRIWGGGCEGIVLSRCVYLFGYLVHVILRMCDNSNIFTQKTLGIECGVLVNGSQYTATGTGERGLLVPFGGVLAIGGGRRINLMWFGLCKGPAVGGPRFARKVCI